MSRIYRSAARLLASIAFGAALVLSARADDSAHPISDMLTDLQRLQVRMAVGDRSAYALQNGLLRTIGEAIVAAKPEVWNNKSETDAAATYVLSGGQPRAIARLIESGTTPKEADNLLRGALAYASGRAREAEALIGDVDPRGVSLRLGGQLAYAQSVLMTTRAPERAIELLDLARLLAPGGLIEEAALRREILLTGDRRDGDRMIFLARQYVSRFPKSIYADNFIQGLATASVRFGLVDDIANLHKFEALMALVNADRRRAFLLTIARTQTVGGRYEVAGAAASDVLAELPAGAPDETRARFYAAAAEFVGRDYQAGLEALEAIDRARLDRADQTLLDAALHTAVHLRDTPSDAQFAQAGREDAVAAARSPVPVDTTKNDPVGATILDADAALRRGDALIRRSEALP